jgi:hypothetical protein
MVPTEGGELAAKPGTVGKQKNKIKLNKKIDLLGMFLG